MTICVKTMPLGGMIELRIAHSRMYRWFNQRIIRRQTDKTFHNTAYVKLSDLTDIIDGPSWLHLHANRYCGYVHIPLRKAFSIFRQAHIARYKTPKQA